MLVKYLLKMTWLIFAEVIKICATVISYILLTFYWKFFSENEIISYFAAKRWMSLPEKSLWRIWRMPSIVCTMGISLRRLWVSRSCDMSDLSPCLPLRRNRVSRSPTFENNSEIFSPELVFPYFIVITITTVCNWLKLLD